MRIMWRLPILNKNICLLISHSDLKCKFFTSVISILFYSINSNMHYHYFHSSFVPAFLFALLLTFAIRNFDWLYLSLYFGTRDCKFIRIVSNQ